MNRKLYLVKSEREYTHLMNYLEGQGYKWSGGGNLSDNVYWDDDTEELVIDVGVARESVSYAGREFYNKHFPDVKIERYIVADDYLDYAKDTAFEIDGFNCDEILEVVVVMSNYDEWRYTGVVKLYEQDGRLVIKTLNYNHIYEKTVSFNHYINVESIVAYNVVEKREEI